MAGRRRLMIAGLLAVALVAPVVPAGAAPGSASSTVETASVLAELATAAPSVEAAEVGDAISERLLVTFRDDVGVAETREVLAAVDVEGHVVPGFSVTSVDVAAADAPAIATALLQMPQVVTVRPDRLLEFIPTADPRRAEQWWWLNTGQEARVTSGPAQVGRRSIDIGAQAGWRASKGQGVVVAIVDTGFDRDHPDLAPNLWENPTPGRFPGCTDDINGCNFTDSGGPGDVYWSQAEDTHGTHLAGIVAAAENAVGTVGVAPRAKLMSVKFLKGNQGLVSDAVNAVKYAVEMGADVINASWGVAGTAGSSAHTLELDATFGQAGIPVVVAAGNGELDRCRGLDIEQYPEFPASSRQPNVIVATAVENQGNLPCFANYSTALVDVAAPGVDILSTFPASEYGYLDGTSQAAPMVTGAVALAISATGVKDGARIAAAVRAGARPFGHLGDQGRPSGATQAGLASAPGTMQALGADLGACRGGAPRAAFPDLHRSDVHTANVDCIVLHQLAGGFKDGTYRPAQGVTRGQVASFLAGLVRTARELEVPRDGRFKDLDGDVHRDNIEALAALGIIDGYNDHTYRPGSRVTREQFASLLVRTYEFLVKGNVRVSGNRFPDVGGVHERNVRAGSQLGFIQGRSDGRFAPRDGVTRAQLASLLRRALDKLVNDRVSRVG